MIKNKGLLIVTLICFIGINTCYFWSGLVGPLFLLLTLACFLTLIIAVLLLLRQLYFLIRERFTDKPRIYSVLGLSVLLALIITQPFGIIDFEKLQGKSVLFAWYKGTANCGSTLKLTANHHYYVRSVCFGVEHRSGTYSITNDTIKFKPATLSQLNAYYEYGVFRKLDKDYFNKGLGVLTLYRSAKDTIHSYPMIISQNELIK
jgi:hypothetical protein